MFYHIGCCLQSVADGVLCRYTRIQEEEVVSSAGHR